MPDPAPAPLPRSVAQHLFAIANEAATGLFLVESRGAVARVELEQGWVHALSNAGPRRSEGDEMLRAFLDGLGADARADFKPRPPRSPLLGWRVTAFHPARVVRAYLEARGAPARDLAGASLRLRQPVHASCLDPGEPPLVALLAAARRFEDLVPLSPRPRLLRLLAFLDAAGALAIEDATILADLALLGLTPGAQPEDIKRAFRRLAAETHPDKHPGADLPQRRTLESRFHSLTEAYRRLLPNNGA